MQYQKELRWNPPNFIILNTQDSWEFLIQKWVFMLKVVFSPFECELYFPCLCQVSLHFNPLPLLILHLFASPRLRSYQVSSIFLISSIWFNSIHHVYPVMIHMINFIHMDSSCFMMSPSLAIWVGIQPQHTYEISPCHHFSSMLKVFIYAFNHSSWMV